MLISVILSLSPTAPTALPTNLGRAAHAWFLNQVRAADPALAQALHEPNKERPFTVSDLWGGGSRKDGVRKGAAGSNDSSRSVARSSNDLSRSVARPGQATQVATTDTYNLRITSFWPELSALMTGRVLPGLAGQTINLAGGEFRVAGVTTDAAAHPWAGQTTYAGLVQQHTLRPGAPPRQITLHFASPTVFRSSGVNVPVPLPGLVWEGLARKWNAFAPLQIPPEVKRFAEESLAMTRYELRTERASFGEDGERGAYPGFVGVCTYSALVQDRYWLGLIHLLAAFAFYAGVGARTAMGLGQARAIA